jgi:hypothetical protein
VKVDVAIQSFGKPESLLFTLMTLKQHSSRWVDAVFIDDDQSKGDVLSAYRSDAVVQYFRPWTLHLRRNRRRVGWWPASVRGYRPSYLTSTAAARRHLESLVRRRSIFVDRRDIRYQWALDTSDKDFVFVAHDDMDFRGDVIGRYLPVAAAMDRPGIVGDLGQCWRCTYKQEPFRCTPTRIIDGYRPSPYWPRAQPGDSMERRPCRINEWSALVSVAAAREIAEDERVFFGNMDDGGDTGAFWFDRAIERGFGFDDPLAGRKHYRHGWQGYPGHAIWSGRGGVRATYDPDSIRAAMRERFGVTLP